MKENFACVSRDLACISSISIILFILPTHSIRDWGRWFSSIKELLVRPALKKNFRRLCFWDLTVRGKNDRREGRERVVVYFSINLEDLCAKWAEHIAFPPDVAVRTFHWSTSPTDVGDWQEHDLEVDWHTIPSGYHFVIFFLSVAWYEWLVGKGKSFTAFYKYPIQIEWP